MLALRLFLFPNKLVYGKSGTRAHLEMNCQVCGLVADILAKSTIMSRVGRCSHLVFVMERKLFVFCQFGPEAKVQTKGWWWNRRRYSCLLAEWIVQPYTMCLRNLLYFFSFRSLLFFLPNSDKNLWLCICFLLGMFPIYIKTMRVSSLFNSLTSVIRQFCFFFTSSSCLFSCLCTFLLYI